MKKLLDNGQEVIVPSGGPPRVRTARPFAGHTFHLDNPTEDTIAATFTLNDGQDYFYEYKAFGSNEASAPYVDRLNHVPPDGFRGATGGILFNQLIRGRIVSKTLI